MGLIGILAFGSSLAFAQDADARARELYDNGAILYAEGRYEDAVAAFSEAYRLSERPALLYNIANAQERLALWREAHETLSRYRAYATADERETLDRRIANLERRMAETPVVQPAVVSTSSAKARETSPWLQPLPLALGVGGAALLVTGGALGAVALGARAEAADNCDSDGSGLLRCPSAVQESVQTDQTLSVVADIAALAGLLGVGAGVGIVLWGEGGILSVGPGFVQVEGSF